MPTRSVKRMLEARSFRNLEIWPRGVDTETFDPARKADVGWPRPVWINVGRVAVEKNTDARSWHHSTEQVLSLLARRSEELRAFPQQI